MSQHNNAPAYKPYRQFAYLIALLALALLVRYFQSQSTQAPGAGQAPPLPQRHERQSPSVQPDDPKPENAHSNAVPQYVLETLNYIRQHHKAPPEFVGGRNFQNREGNLPKTDAKQNAIQYQEWDVYPKVSGQNRGPERLVTGSDGSAWYTSDHYRHFIQIE